MSLARLTPARLGSYGEHWGEGASRCFSLDGDFLDEEQGVRLMPVPESFICPISMCVMENPVATVDGAIYERAYIEQWHRQRREEGLPITSPATGIELPSPTLMPLTALQKAIETYITHRPEIKDMRMNGRALQEAATLLQSELLDKQAAHANAQDELTRLRDMLLERDLRCAHLSRKLEQAKQRLRLLETSQEGSDKPTIHKVAAEPDIILSKKLCDTGVVKNVKACDDCCNSHLLEKPAVVSRASGRGSTRKWSLALPVGWHSERLLCGSKDGQHRLHRHLVVAGCVAALVLAFLTLQHSEQLERAQAAAGVMSLAASSPMAGLLASGMTQSNCSEELGLMPGVNTLFHAGAVAFPGMGPDLDVTLRSMQEKLAGGPSEKLQAISSLFQLAASSVGNQIEMLQADVIRPLIDLLNDDLPHLCEMAANVVAVLASTAEGSRAIISVGAVGPLLRVLEVGNPGARMQAATVFATLAAADTKSKDALALGGAIPALVSLLKDEDPRIREVGANALAHLAAGSARNQELVAREGAASCLVRLLRGSSWPSQQHAARALAALAEGNARTASEVERSGALGPLVALLQGARPPQVQAAASAALENLVESGLGVNEMVPHLVRSLRQQQQQQPQLGGSWASQDVVTRSGDFASPEDARQRQLDGSSRAAKLLKIVAAGSRANQDVVVQAGALPPLVAMLACEGSDCAEARIQASEALTMLAEGNTANQILISRSGAIAPLVHLLDSGSVDEQVSAAGALEQLQPHSGEDRLLITQAFAKIDRILS